MVYWWRFDVSADWNVWIVFLAPPPVQQDPVRDPCFPSPCGPYSQCRDIGGQPSCSCLPEYTGVPPNCRPECVISAECPSNKACIREKCRDPCPGSCGAGAQCSVISHTPSCSCPAGYTGDPFTNCYPAPPIERKLTFTVVCALFIFCRLRKMFWSSYCVFSDQVEADPDPCSPSPCGPNAQCADGVCTCLPEYQGDPYVMCRPECVLNADCPRDKACIGNKCKDPCPGTCGVNANCEVINHIPTCVCPDKMTGNPFLECRPAPAGG